MVEFFKRREAPERVQERRQEVVAELDDPRLEEMSTRLFEGRIRLVQLTLDGRERGPYGSEYAPLQEQEDRLLAEHGRDLFLYETRKASQYNDKKLWWIYQNHWDGMFLKPEYLGALGGELNEHERRFVFDHISRELRASLKETRKEGRTSRTMDAIASAKDNLEALLPFLSGRERRRAVKLIERASGVATR